MDYKFQNYFSSKIWSRGKDYVQKGLVNNIEVNGNVYTATVYGSRKYHVEIGTNKNHLNYMECNCPYAEEGHRCKHMAALAIIIENQELSTTYSSKYFFDEYQWMLEGRVSFFEMHEMLSKANRYYRTNRFKNTKHMIEECKNACIFLNLLNYRKTNDFDLLLDSINQKIKTVRKTKNWETEDEAWLCQFLETTNDKELFSMTEQIILEDFTEEKIDDLLTIVSKIRVLENQSEFLGACIDLMKKSNMQIDEITNKVKKFPLRRNDLNQFISYFEKENLINEGIDFLKSQLNSSVFHSYCLDIILKKLSEYAKMEKDKKSYLCVVDASVKYGDYYRSRYLSAYKNLFKKKEWEEQKNELFNHWKNELLDEDYFEVLKFYNEIPFLIEFLLEHDQFNIVYHCFHLIYDWNKEVALQLLCDSYIKKVYENDNVYDFSSDLRSIHFFDDYDDEIIIKDELFYRLKEKFKNKPQFLKEIELLEKQMEERYESMR